MRPSGQTVAPERAEDTLKQLWSPMLSHTGHEHRGGKASDFFLYWSHLTDEETEAP